MAIVEEFQPRAVKSEADAPLIFAARCAIDLQLATIAAYLRPALSSMSGCVLDIGAGQSPWRHLLPKDAHYYGIDVGYAAEFGMAQQPPDVTYYDGRTIPFGDAGFDHAFCIEVLEHCSDPNALLQEMARVLRPGGSVVLTVPWSARRHHLPHDYYRFTKDALQEMLSEAGFEEIDIKERGTDIHAVANKLIVISLRWLRPKASLLTLLTLPLGVATSAVAVIFLCLAHLSKHISLGSSLDPLGYSVSARRKQIGATMTPAAR